MGSLVAFTKLLGYTFRNQELLIEALTHPSKASKRKDSGLHYERLEFLGDAVLGLVMKEILFRKHPNYQEGQLSKKSAALTSGEICGKVGTQLGIQNVMQVSKGEERNGGRVLGTNISNTLEAILAAVYLDSQSIETCKAIVETHWGPLLDIEDYHEPKTTLQEWSQSQIKSLPKYTLVATTGPEHKPNFIVEVELENGLKVSAEGGSKRVAEQNAAKRMISVIQETIEEGKYKP